MSITVFFVVLFAACLHALWNTAVKGMKDKQNAMAAVIIGHIPFALVSIAFSPMPDWECWPYLVVGICLHFGYQIFLLNAYRFGDLTQVYPIARGVAPLLIALISLLFLGVVLSSMETLALSLIVAGLLSLAIVRKADGKRNPKAVYLALATGCMIAGYSLVDGIGARIAGTAFGFFGWLALINSLVMLVYMLGMRHLKPSSNSFKMNPHLFLLGGGISYIAYALVMWGFTQAPIALVTALRETSIVFALLLGVFFLKERLDLIKVIATLLSITGAVILRLGK